MQDVAHKQAPARLLLLRLWPPRWTGELGGKMNQRIKTFLAGGVLALAMIGNAGAGPLEDGLAAYEKGDYPTAMRLLRPLAERGDANAQTKLGAMYYNSYGVPKDYKQAFLWWRKAAEQGGRQAQGALGFMYQEGSGVPQDYVQAYMWFDIAASHSDGDIDAIGRNFITTYLMTPQQIAEGQRLATEWARRHHETEDEEPKASPRVGKDCSDIPKENRTLDCAL
jgi:uncharacterized protein